MACKTPTEESGISANSIWPYDLAWIGCHLHDTGPTILPIESAWRFGCIRSQPTLAQSSLPADQSLAYVLCHLLNSRRTTGMAFLALVSRPWLGCHDCMHPLSVDMSLCRSYQLLKDPAKRTSHPIKILLAFATQPIVNLRTIISERSRISDSGYCLSIPLDVREPCGLACAPRNGRKVF